MEKKKEAITKEGISFLLLLDKITIDKEMKQMFDNVLFVEKSVNS